MAHQFALRATIALTAFEGERSEAAGNILLICPPDRHNIETLHQAHERDL